MISVLRDVRRFAGSKSAALTFVSFFLCSGTLYAQGYVKPGSRKLCLGFDAAFGIRYFKVTSNMKAINGMDVLEEGGSAGLLFGNNIVQAKLRQGYFYSAASVPYTTDLVESTLELNINPLQMLRFGFRRCEPYLLAGIARNAIRFHGHYADLPSSNFYEELGTSQVNYSRSEMPYLGRVVLGRAEVGIGVLYRVKMIGSFLRFFGEVRYGWPVGKAATLQFEETGAGRQVAVSVGTSFGWKI
jgi:hypothetical protein